jgi:hypothetical protein
MKHDVFSQQRQVSVKAHDEVQETVAAPNSSSIIGDSGNSSSELGALAPPPAKFIHIKRVTLSPSERKMCVAPVCYS